MGWTIGWVVLASVVGPVVLTLLIVVCCCGLSVAGAGAEDTR